MQITVYIQGFMMSVISKYMIMLGIMSLSKSSGWILFLHVVICHHMYCLILFLESKHEVKSNDVLHQDGFEPVHQGSC